MSGGGRFQVAAGHIDAYQEYNLLVGEADGGAPLPQREYDALRATARRIDEAGQRLYVYWRNTATQADCYCVGPSSRCFCGHGYSGHAWFETETRRVRCRVPGCKCPCFRYVNGRGSQFIRCTCKHEHTDHRSRNGIMGQCTKGRCACAGFHSEWRCGSCNEPWGAHSTVFESRAERAARGLDVDNLAGGGSAVAAACGGVTRYASLLPGCERAAAQPLPFTDGCAAALPASAAHAGRLRGQVQQKQQAVAPRGRAVGGAGFAGDAARGLLALDAAHDAAAARRAAGAPTKASEKHRLGGASVPRPGPLLGRRSRQPTAEEIRERAAAAAERRVAAAAAERGPAAGA
eukprot:TRINITY_DN219_c0_g1_i1.p1 TRINITY_DN219_c0_g1~~TRINITY_DN219_c0_g1_i1.p1  ORF type:complete len:347 (+),score=96.04 TRINITY_DN219_c0_g1_i1:75-1115(+)